MKKEIGRTLLQLSEADQRIVGLTIERREIEDRRKALITEIDGYKEALGLIEAELKEEASRQALEEHRLKDEEQKIVERRKQLSALGGAKAAKIMEREIDIASRSMEDIEESAMQAVEEVDRLETRAAELRSQLEEAQRGFEEEDPESIKELEQIEEDLEELAEERKGYLDSLPLDIRSLYGRVQGRYSDSAVSIAKKGSCRACYRALPPQTYNQILAGALIQCPACARILISEEVAEG